MGRRCLTGAEGRLFVRVPFGTPCEVDFTVEGYQPTTIGPLIGTAEGPRPSTVRVELVAAQ
jgi:hypothetical protein